MNPKGHGPTNAVLTAVREALRGTGRSQLPPPLDRFQAKQPASAAPRAMAERQQQFLQEVAALSGQTAHLEAEQLGSALRQLVQAENIRKATLWPDTRLEQLQVAAQLAALGVELIPAQADPRRLAECDLGVTAVDLAIPETGTIGLFSSAEKPRLVSLLPRVHLALLTAETPFLSLDQALQRAAAEHYLILISGPSRTADIELTLTLGVHGPQTLVVWLMTTDAPG